MTKKQQVKKDTPKAVELNKAALDQAAGGPGGFIAIETVQLGSKVARSEFTIKKLID